ncbi:MAG: tRNA-binding protein [Candidatus Paceibacterota bacterium]
MNQYVATFEDFERLNIRVGRIAEAAPVPEGGYWTHLLLVDLGSEVGTKASLVRLAPNYESDELVGGQVLCVLNFPPRQAGKQRSEVLVLGAPDEKGNLVLIRPDTDVPIGGRL